MNISSKAKKTNNLVGRPCKKLTSKQIKKITSLAAYLTIEQIADYFCISESTFHRLKNEDERILTAYKKGRIEKIIKYTEKLEDKAMGFGGVIKH